VFDAVLAKAGGRIFRRVKTHIYPLWDSDLSQLRILAEAPVIGSLGSFFFRARSLILLAL
jgi:hypothetical protein